MPLIASVPALAFLLASARAATPWGPKDWGVLVLAADGAQTDRQTLQDLVDGLRKRFPVETASGLTDVREIQHGLDALAAQQVRKVVVVPLALASDSLAMDEAKYVLGLSRDPSADFFKHGRNHAGYTNIRRAQTRLPIVLASALDEHPVVAEILAQRARALSRTPSRERLVLVGRESGGKAQDALMRQRARTLAVQVASSLGMAGGDAALLSSLDASEDAREASEKGLHDLVFKSSRRGRVIVVPYLLVQDGTERRVPQVLDGLFYAWRGDALMPDPRIAHWVETKAREASALPNMRRFTDEGRPLPPPETKHMLRAAR